MSIEKAKHHIATLGNHKAIARIAGIHETVIHRIVNDRVTGIYKSTEDAILSVTKREVDELWPLLADEGSFLPAKPIKKMVADLRKSGFTDSELGRKVNLKSGLRVLGKKYVRAYNARRIEQIYRKSGVAA